MSNIINRVKTYFKLQELVCPHIYNKYGDTAWQFMNPRLLETLYIIRNNIIKESMIVNNWYADGNYSQRGLRCNLCEIPKSKTNSNTVYMSAHCTGNAIDFTTPKYDADRCRQLIENSSFLLPYNIRLEIDINWVHFDLYDTGNKIYKFRG